MKVLVVGGAGYIGSHTCKALAMAGHDPVVYDNLSTGHSHAVRWGPLEIGDIRDTARLDAVLARHRPDVVMHFAALAYVGASVLEPSTYYDVNVGGTLNLLQCMKARGLERIVFSSTCATYGTPETLPIREDTPQKPINPYGFTKLAVERMLRDFEAAYGLRWMALRYFNAAGCDPEGEIGEEHDPETHAIPLALRAALGRSSSFTVFGSDYDTPDGSAVRDYVHVCDLADAHVRAAEHLLAGGRSAACNLATGKGTSVLEIVAAVEEATGRPVPLAHGPRRSGDPAALYASADLARDLLGWRPKFLSIAETIGTAAAWFVREGAVPLRDPAPAHRLGATRITMVGTGYVGLVTGACFADLGHEVICVDNDVAKIERLRNGVMPIYEPGLDELVSRNVRAGRLSFSSDLASSVKGRDAIFIAVGTPSEAGSGRADLKHVFAAAAEVAVNLDGFCVVVTKSTVPVGTNRKIADLTAALLPPGVSMAVGSNPEFLREGSAIADFMNPDRIVIGADDPRARAMIEQIYRPLAALGHPLMSCGLETAEVVKYAANAFLAVKVTFMNEVSDLCEAVDADVQAVAAGIGSDHRIGPAFLRVGPGWGGSCFPKDTRALVTTAHDHQIRLKVVEACIDANHERKVSMVGRVEGACGDLKDKFIAVLGLTFKGQTDDLRESPSLELVAGLLARGARIHAYDPSRPTPGALPHAGVRLADSPQAAVEGADALVVATDWQEFADYDLSELADLMADPVMVDLRNIYDPQATLAAGFRRYVSLGRTAQFEATIKPGARSPDFLRPPEWQEPPSTSVAAE